MENTTFRRTAIQFDGFLQRLKLNGRIRSQNDFALLVLEKMSYTNLASELSALKLGKKIPSPYIMNAVCQTLIDCGVSSLEVEVFAETTRVEKQKSGVTVNVNLYRHLLTHNPDLDPIGKMELVKGLLKAHNALRCLSVDEQITYLCDFFDLGTPFFDTMRLRLMTGETITAEECEQYFFHDMPQLTNFGNVHRLYYHNPDLAKRYPVPPDAIDLESFDTVALEKVCNHLRQKFRDGSWLEQTSIAFYLSRLLPFLSDDNGISEDFKEIITYDSQGKGFWASNTAAVALLNTQRQHAKKFFKQAKLNEGIEIRKKIIYQDDLQGNLFDICMENFLPTLNDNTLGNHHVAMSYLGEFRAAVPLIARGSWKISFDKLERINDLVWSHDNWYLAQAMSLDLIQQFSGYLQDKDKSRADALLDKFTPHVDEGFQSVLPSLSL